MIVNGVVYVDAESGIDFINAVETLAVAFSCSGPTSDGASAYFEQEVAAASSYLADKAPRLLARMMQVAINSHAG